ncbi:porin [Comamonas thiooxydans]|uniref:porin n=1 Tax=Comamonas thiooxydans TaxID=363952 RepID=UPI001E3D94AC|nr:porin [Comamonas thiooxydans]MCO8249579.1 porin [Comamonas thiooxydans]BDB69669.1 porin [Comamonas thiooxydans]
MKHVALACTLLATACGAVQAQTTVTIYGVLDAGVEHLSSVGGSGSLTRMPGLGVSVPSRLGFRGTEDLGGGLKAIFTLESGFGTDSGTLNQGGRFFGRQAFVGLSGDWGSVTLGRQYSMLFWSQLDADILGPNAYGAGSLDSYLPNARVDNSIAYRGTFNGLTVGATYSFGRDTVNANSPSGTNCAGESATDKSACRQWSAMVKYDASTWGASAAIDEIRGGAGAFAGLNSSDKKDRRTTVAGWAKFAALKVGGGVIARSNDATPVTRHSNLWYLGASYPITPALVLDGQVFKLNYKHSDNQALLYAIRGTYHLSKRTALFATAGHIANDGSLALSVSGAAAGGGTTAGGSQTGVAVGVRHSF